MPVLTSTTLETLTKKIYKTLEDFEKQGTYSVFEEMMQSFRCILEFNARENNEISKTYFEMLNDLHKKYPYLEYNLVIDTIYFNINGFSARIKYTGITNTSDSCCILSFLPPVEDIDKRNKFIKELADGIGTVCPECGGKLMTSVATNNSNMLNRENYRVIGICSECSCIIESGEYNDRSVAYTSYESMCAIRKLMVMYGPRTKEKE